MVMCILKNKRYVSETFWRLNGRICGLLGIGHKAECEVKDNFNNSILSKVDIIKLTKLRVGRKSQ